jgi:peptidoglycan/xylan/chitin deacetylase (PgdA/CDA1 family)
MRKLIFVVVILALLCSKANSKEILISFDGSDWLDRWEDTLTFAKENKVKFTYFISSPYFVTEKEIGDFYWAQQQLSDKCLIKPRKNEQSNQIRVRFAYLNRAVIEGHEIGCHFVGHYNGRKWTQTQWMNELLCFKWEMTLHHEFDFDNITGCRAPYMCTSPEYFKAIKEFGFVYDSSSTTALDKGYVASGATDKVQEIPVKRVHVTAPGYKGWNQAPFDCDYITEVQSRIFPDTMSNTINAQVLEETKKIEDYFFDNLCNSYLTGPTPMQICLHFQHRLGDPYVNAMKRFVKWVKDKDPQFMTYSEYAKVHKR